MKTLRLWLWIADTMKLRLLELEAKAPLFTHFTETFSGLATIRAFDHQGSFLQRGLELLDASQRPFYFLFCIQRWLNLVLDLVIAGLAVALVALAVELPGTTSGGAIGIALVNVLNYNQLLAELVTAWTSLETSIGAVARVKNFVKETEQETQPAQSSDVAGDWPAYGSINIQGITASYRPDCGPVLNDLSLNITPGEKVGICGRSGGGKSSLILVLLRLLDLSNGTISIDNIPINEVNREDIRSRLNVLPQDPVILPGSLRFNMDPSGSSLDTQIMSALKRVGLWDVIHAQGGLDSEIDAINLSHGQLQLLAFARAMIRKGQILIMDEATSSLDADSEALIDQLIREEFADKTVLAVAHRLRTIRYFDRVAVLDSGRIVETGKPDDLLETENGYFRRLWETNN
jgi:ATP-binding cassette, subfamily C (CFTR/MRP), member 1